MSARFDPNSCQWIVKLDCGHLQLASPAEYTVRGTRCRHCPPRGWGRVPPARTIIGRLGLTPVCHHGKVLTYA